MTDDGKVSAEAAGVNTPNDAANAIIVAKNFFTKFTGFISLNFFLIVSRATEKLFKKSECEQSFTREKILSRAKKISRHSASDSFFCRKILFQFNVSLQDETDHSAILDLVKRIRFDAEIFHASTERNLNQFAGVSRCLFAQGD